jgi:hypothetical protein
MGSYSNAITQDLRTVVEGAETVASPESQLTQPLSAGIKADQWMQNVKLEQVMPGAIKAGGAVTIQDVSSDIVDRVLQSSDTTIDKVIESADVHLARADIFTQDLIKSVMESADEQTEQAIDQASQAVTELGSVARSVAAQRESEIAGFKSVADQIFDNLPGAVTLLVIAAVVFYAVSKSKGK